MSLYRTDCVFITLVLVQNKPQAPPAHKQALGVQGQQGDPSQGQADAQDQDMDASGATQVSRKICRTCCLSDCKQD